MKLKEEISIKDFYELVRDSKRLKKEIFNLLVESKNPSEKQIFLLKDFLKKFKFFKNKKIFVSDSLTLKFKLNYEILELEKDIIFLEKGEEALLNYFVKIHKNFKKQNDKIKNYLDGKEIGFFITDRDGTINNYCGNYFSSVQSIYNAFFLYNFSKNLKKTIILSSGPLNEFEKVNIISKGNFVLAGSKAREFKILNGKKYFMDFSKSEKKILSDLEKSIEKLLCKKDFEKFKFIGSGFQKKQGELTIAHQDVWNSVPEKESQNFLLEIKKIVEKLDSEKKFFCFEDTGKDIEIILKSGLENFHKGKGLNFILDKLNLSLSNVLVCGNTGSDLPLLESCKDLSKQVYCIFVTKDKSLRKKIKKVHKDSLFVSSPDVLTNALYEISK